VLLWASASMTATRPTQRERWVTTRSRSLHGPPKRPRTEAHGQPKPARHLYCNPCGCLPPTAPTSVIPTQEESRPAQPGSHAVVVTVRPHTESLLETAGVLSQVRTYHKPKTRAITGKPNKPSSPCRHCHHAFAGVLGHPGYPKSGALFLAHCVRIVGKKNTPLPGTGNARLHPLTFTAAQEDCNNGYHPARYWPSQSLLTGRNRQSGHVITC
jgi:hypothetical protein